jgi:hypothetical protein
VDAEINDRTWVRCRILFNSIALFMKGTYHGSRSANSNWARRESRPVRGLQQQDRQQSEEINNSGDGCLPEYNDATTITKCLQTLNSKLQDGIRAPTTANERALQELWVGCEEVAQGLLGVLDMPKVEGKKSKLKNIGRALKGVWRDDKIERISKRLVHFREQLILTLLVNLRNADIA